ncbi:MAG: diguanylate cyclase [Synergistaceae bacterium]|nr:diguanylate cyclase [Synergistaceae bacterium]
MSIWSGVLDSCPGLLCCVINIKGRLIYATHGYKAVAARLFGHKCEEGGNYPPLITELDRDIHESLTAACLGNPNAMEITHGNDSWEFTASPLRLDDRGVSGVVIRLVSESRTKAPVIQTNPDILNSVPFRACVADSHGVILAANKFLTSALGLDPTGSNIAEIVEPSVHSELMHIITARSGCAECLMSDTGRHENFYEFTAESVYLDANHNKIPEAVSENFRRVRLHASTIEWAGKESVMLTFEDITDSQRTQEQLRRLLTFDSTTGILNRRGIEHIILRELGAAVRNARSLSLICLSLDNLGQITERLGWSAGEKVIRSFVKNMKDFLEGRAKSAAAVWNRGEFMILAHCTGAVSVVMANEIRERSGLMLSAGIADFADGGYSGVSEFIGAAYDAMIHAKIDGGNKTALADRT